MDVERQRRASGKRPFMLLCASSSFDSFVRIARTATESVHRTWRYANREDHNNKVHDQIKGTRKAETCSAASIVHFRSIPHPQLVVVRCRLVVKIVLTGST